LEEFKFDWDEHDVVGVFVCVSDDKFEIAERRPECDEFTLEHVNGSDALESVLKRLNFR
jgi:hypothetical protein